MRILAWTAGLPGALVLVLLAVCGIVNFLPGDEPWPLSRPATDDPRSKYRVAVLGDSQKGIGNLEMLLDAVSAEGVDLILHTGDLVASNDEGHYRLAARVFRRAAPRVPAAVAPGNHDIKGDPSRFERILGPLEQSFRRGQVFYVVLNNASGHPPELRRLEAKIAAAPRDAAVVLAMHVPPFDVTGNTFPGYEPFVAWLERSRVRYLLCGQIHDYVRREIGGTVVIANGVGGDFESWQLRQKAYATILEVDGTSITDRPVERPPVHGIGENLEHLAVGHVAEAYRSRPWACWPATALLAALVGGAFLRLRRGAAAGRA